MELVVFFKAGLVGSLGFIIAIVAVIALLTFASEAQRLATIKARKLFALITLIIVWGIGWGVSYWYFATISAPDERVLTTFACLFALTPSLAMVSAAFSYYLEVQKNINIVNKEKTIN